MDPIAESIKAFNARVAAALAEPDVRVVLVASAPEHVPLLAKSLRALEWDAENRAPFLIHQAPCTTPEDAFATIDRVTREHYAALRQGLAEEGTELRPLHSPVPGAPSAEDALAHTILDMAAATKGVLEPPLLCWLPSNTAGDPEWAAAAVRLMRPLWQHPIRFVMLAEAESELARCFGPDAAPVLRIVPFELDESATQDHFAKLLAAPAAGRAPGTLPGSAAPDVEPPPRPRPPPSEEAIREQLEKAGIKGVLAPEAAERLRACVVAAAAAAGKADGANALAQQDEACRLCNEAEARVEEVMMLLLLAAYQQQFGQPLEQVEATYRRAEEVAGEAGAYAQLSQARLGLAYLLLSADRVDDAIACYEQTAFAALVGGVNLIVFEALRLVGTCHLRLGRSADAELCWAAAIRHARDFSPDEIRLTDFTSVAAQLIELLEQQGRPDHARAVEQVVAAVGAAAQNGGAA